MADDETDPAHAPGATVRLEGAARGALKLILDVLRLEVTGGPDAGRAVGLALPVVRIGSAPDNDLVLSDASVSGHHAEVEASGEGLAIRDLGSTNGTFVGDLRVRDAALPAGTPLRLGETTLRVTRGQETRRALAADGDRLGSLVGRAAAMRTLFTRLEAVAPTPVNVLLQAESGCGKELAARTIHDLSGRPGPLVTFDAATADKDMLRSDLFGHEKGAFTGADAAREGAFRAAQGGTLFLDELGELPLDLQPRLLRALESRSVQPVGSDRAVPVDVRVVAATHRDLKAMVEAGEFRADLYHRLAVIPLRIPPLRERLEDLDLLIEHLSEGLPAPLELSAEARAALRAHPWPGNVRELRNVLERAAVLCAGRAATPADLLLDGAAPASPPSAAATGPEAEGEPATLEEVEREAVLAALARNHGNKTATAQELGIGINTLRRKLKAYGVDG